MTAGSPYPQLFTPHRIGSLELPNRVVMSAMYTAAGSASGHVTDRQIQYYALRAEAGVGLIVTENVPVHRDGGHDHHIELAAGKRLSAGGRLAYPERPGHEVIQRRDRTELHAALIAVCGPGERDGQPAGEQLPA